MAYKKILITRTALKIPFDCIIVRPGTGKPNFNIAMNDRIYFEDGEIKKVAEEDIHVPEPNTCWNPSCDEVMVDGACPVHGEPPTP